ncbi:MAG: hypothetical protein KF878_07870 [Planctomycetes bacterium]|nr:hypothetical protein [Planctomycetota bacterium]
MARRSGRLLAAAALAASLSACATYQATAVPSHSAALPVSRALWTDARIEAGEHAAIVSTVVAASGVCGRVPGDERLVLHLGVVEAWGPITPLDLLCGVSLFTIPSWRSRDIVVAGRLVDEESGHELAAVQAQSRLNVLLSWPLAVVGAATGNLDGDDLARRNVRALTCHVVARLVEEHRRRRGPTPEPGSRVGLLGGPRAADGR